MNKLSETGKGALLPEHLANSSWIEHAANIPARFDYQYTQVAKVSFDLLRENRIIAAIEPGPFTNSYKILRSQVLHTLREKNWNTVAITSPRNSEGKTLTAINFAISLAMEVDHTVLLVDANLRDPAVDQFFGIEAKYGLSDCLLEDKPLEEVLIHPSGIDRFIFLPAGKPLINAGEMLASHRMVKFIADVKLRYPARIIVFDLPPILVAGESLQALPYIDTTLLVVEAGKTKKEDITRAESLLYSANVLGTVLSKT